MNEMIVKEERSIARQPSNRKKIYSAIWRWHFYAGIFFTPLIVFLTITGGIYLFKAQIEDYIYKEFYYVQQGQAEITATEQINEVRKNYPNAELTSFTPSADQGKTAVVGMIDMGENISVYVNPYNGDIVGTIKENDRFMAFVKQLHNGELWGGTFGNRLVELAACWTITLVVTGCYLWWPRNRKSVFGTIIPRIRSLKGKRMFWRDMHAVTAIWLSIFIVIQVLSGLMWSDVWGGMAHRVTEVTGTGGPVGDNSWETYAFPKSTIPTKEVADVPWAAETIPVPESTVNGASPIPVENVITTVENNQVHPGYQIVFPQTDEGVYTVFLDTANVFPNRPGPWTQQTLHIDQYSGEPLINYSWKDYGILAKAMSLGIAFHQGEFGFISQLFMLLLMIGIIMIIISGFIMWWKRRPKGKLGAPPVPKDQKMLKGLAVIIVALGIFFPLVGLSLIIVWIVDHIVIRRLPKVKQWLG